MNLEPVYILWETHKGKNARYCITRAGDKAPCSCLWQERDRFFELKDAIKEKQRLEKLDNLG